MTVRRPFPNRNRRVPGALAAAWLLSLALAACSRPDGAADDLATASIALTEVPPDVGCVRITVVGARSVQRDFDVKPGQSTELRMNGLPTGDVSFFGEAHAGSCAKVSPGQPPAWIGGPVPARLDPGVLTQVLIALRQNGRSLVTVDFQIDPSGVPCVGDDKGCLDPNDASGSASEPIPDGARMISAAEAGPKLKEGTLILGSARIEQATEADRQKRDEGHRAFVRQALANQPELLERLMREPVEDQRLARLPDGNYELITEDSLGNEIRVVTMGSWFKWGEVASSLKNFRTRDNQLGLYVQFYENLPREYVQRNQLPPPQELANTGADEIYRLNLRIVGDWANIRDLIVIDPTPMKPACADELGAPPVRTDQVGGACTPSAGSLFGATSFPLKPYTTCVKNQAGRGTCVSFGISGAVETRVAVKRKQWMNLSEQRLYYWAKVPTAFGDGLWTDAVINDMIATSFTYPFEFSWDYNPSLSRASVSSTYVNSCVGYSGEHCSDTAHQGDRVCFDILGLRFCGWDGTAPPTAGIKMTGALHLWDFGASAALAWGRLALALKIPLVVSTDVTPSFDGAASNGVVTYAGSSETSRGGHAMAVMGFVDNDRLPPGIGPGAGGGYLIVKNSWGSCWKDGGYVYLPYQWLTDYTWMLQAVTGTN